MHGAGGVKPCPYQRMEFELYSLRLPSGRRLLRADHGDSARRSLAEQRRNALLRPPSCAGRGDALLSVNQLDENTIL